MMKMTLSIFLLILLASSPVLSSSLKICINTPISEAGPDKFANNPISKEVLFKNVYETLFYYSRKTNKIKANIASRIEVLQKNQYLLKLNKNVYFHNNKIFTVKKSVDYKDVIFSLQKSKSSHFKDFKITTKGLRFTSELGIKNIYMELSKPKHVILSRAYWRYLKKKKKESLYFERPIGTGPFQINKVSLPYQLIKFKNYHLANRIQKITYILSKDYIKDACDIFWDDNILKKKDYIRKYGYNSKSSDYNSLLFFYNSNENKKITKIIDPIVLKSELLKTLDSKLTILPIPPRIKETYLLNKKETKLKEKTEIKISVDEIIYTLFPKKEFIKALKKYFLNQNVILNIMNERGNIHLTIETDLKDKKELNTKLYCRYKSKACNKTKDLNELQSILLKENIIIPLAFYKRYIFYKKHISNIKFDFTDTIDYSEILTIQN